MGEPRATASSTPTLGSTSLLGPDLIPASQHFLAHTQSVGDTTEEDDQDKDIVLRVPTNDCDITQFVHACIREETDRQISRITLLKFKSWAKDLEKPSLYPLEKTI